MRQLTRRGFTLLELLVVIAIIAGGYGVNGYGVNGRYGVNASH
jgi:prepilin-type N-terminal cleavage/methylation domain-containing protein